MFSDDKSLFLTGIEQKLKFNRQPGPASRFESLLPIFEN